MRAAPSIVKTRAICLPSVLPESFKSLRAELRIAHRVRDVLVPEVLLDRAGIVPIIRELIAGRVPQHVRMDGEGEGGELAGASDHFARRRRRHGPAALGDEQVGRFWVLPAELAKRSELRPSDRMRRQRPVLQTRHVHQAGLEVDLLPAHGHEFRDAKRMTVSQEDQRAIAMAMPADLGRGLQHLVDLVGG